MKNKDISPYNFDARRIAEYGEVYRAVRTCVQNGESMESYINRMSRNMITHALSCSAISDSLIYTADDQLRKAEEDYPKAAELRAEMMRYYGLYNERLAQSTALDEDAIADFKLYMAQAAKPQLDRLSAAIAARLINLDVKYPVTATRLLTAVMCFDLASSVYALGLETIMHPKRLPRGIEAIRSGMFFLDLANKKANAIADIFVPLDEVPRNTDGGEDVEAAYLAVANAVLDPKVYGVPMERAFKENGVL